MCCSWLQMCDAQCPHRTPHHSDAQTHEKVGRVRRCERHRYSKEHTKPEATAGESERQGQHAAANNGGEQGEDGRFYVPSASGFDGSSVSFQVGDTDWYAPGGSESYMARFTRVLAPASAGGPEP